MYKDNDVYSYAREHFPVVIELVRAFRDHKTDAPEGTVEKIQSVTLDLCANVLLEMLNSLPESKNIPGVSELTERQAQQILVKLKEGK